MRAFARYKTKLHSTAPEPSELHVTVVIILELDFMTCKCGQESFLGLVPLAERRGLSILGEVNETPISIILRLEFSCLAKFVFVEPCVFLVLGAVPTVALVI